MHRPRDRGVQTDWRSSQVPIRHRHPEVHAAHLSFFLYIASMRWVTRKPPKIFTEASATAATPTPLENSTWRAVPASGAVAASRAPTTITDETALVTLISGVCRAGVTLQ